jgi:phage/plasmid-like protein (TIGR03299 family)
MSAEIESIMYVGDVPWHGLGVYCGEEPITSKEAIIKAGLDWNVELTDLFLKNKEGEAELLEKHKAVVRESDSSILGVVGGRYTPVQNAEAFSFMDALVEDKSMRYHTAGSLRGGQKVWLLGQVGSYEVVPEDKVDNFLFLYNSHDGSSALRCLFTTVRVVCANTARLALQKGNKEGLTIRHTSNIMTNLASAKEILKIGKVEFNKFELASKELVKKQIDTIKLDHFLKNLIPDPPKDIRSYRAERTRNELTRLFEEGRGNDLLNVKGSAWAAFNAVTEFANYYTPARGENKQERRFENILFGSNVQLVEKAQKLLLAA